MRTPNAKEGSRAQRQLGALGSRLIAHVSKAESADQKPFEPAFWHRRVSHSEKLCLQPPKINLVGSPEC